VTAYHYYVSVDNDNNDHHDTKYNGDQAADAMAAWSKAITDGAEYATLEALRDQP
jgi:hypothetical protein